ncbi:response regulator transcription factor [Streptomyces sp. NPDC050759]|uniref:response regulator transcription factor n=1 Tax=Streptomyces sp. NPDC050759 TaxID=3365635 RepID=UPI0037A873EE
MTVRIVLADDQPLSGTGTEAVRTVPELRPDVVGLDIRMPGMDGREATRVITANAPAPGVLMLTTFDDDSNVHAALRAGASGFLVKDMALDDVLSATRIVAGDALIAPSVTRRLIDGRAGPGPHRNRVRPGGRLVFHVFAALAEFTRLGRPPAMTPEQVRHAATCSPTRRTP